MSSKRPLYIHRARFVDYDPPSINSIAFSHQLSKDQSLKKAPSSLRLAIGKTSGDIEIWRPIITPAPSGLGHQTSFFHEKTMKGGRDRSIEGLCWTIDPVSEGGQLRLFSIGYSTVVTEWDLNSGRPKLHCECTGGAIWSIAAQPRVQGSEDDDSLLAVGMEDGSVLLLSTKDGELNFVKTLPRSSGKKARVLSLCWQGRDRIVAGMADSTIRVWDVRAGRLVERMTLGRELTRGKDVLIWAIKCIKGGDIISGDSNGEILVWNGKNYTLKQRLKSHGADIMALEINAAGDLLYSTGIDTKTVIHQLVNTDGRKRWGEVGHRRFHSHDVRTMAAFESSDFSYVISGGVDMTPFVIPLRNFASELHWKLPSVPQQPICQTVPSQRLLLAHYEQEIKLWRIARLNEVFRSDLDLDLEDDSQGRQLVSKIMLNDEENITSACLSNPYDSERAAGNLLAVGTVGALKLFYLRPSKAKAALRVSKVDLPSSFVVKRQKKVEADEDGNIIPTSGVEDDEDSDSDDEEEVEFSEEGTRLLQFSPDGKWLLVVTASSRIFLLEIAVAISENLRADVTISPHAVELVRASRPVIQTNAKKLRTEGSLGDDYARTVHRVAFNPESSMLAVSDLAGWTDIFALSSDSWTLASSSGVFPRLPSAAGALHFRPTSDSPSDTLLIAIPSPQSFYEFSALKGTLTTWSRANPPELFPAEYANRTEVPAGILTEESDGKKRVWVWSCKWLFMFDLNKNLRKEDAVKIKETVEETHKRKRGGVLGGNKVPDWVKERANVKAIKERGEDVDMRDAEDDDDEPGSRELIKHSQRADEDDYGEQGNNEPFWSTHKYQSLLGVLPIGQSSDSADVDMDEEEKFEDEVFRELLVIERPYFEVEKGPRYLGRAEIEYR